MCERVNARARERASECRRASARVRDMSRNVDPGMRTKMAVDGHTKTQYRFVQHTLAAQRPLVYSKLRPPFAPLHLSLVGVGVGSASGDTGARVKTLHPVRL